MERGARLSGSRFAYLRGDLVFLELALVRWALEKLRGHGFEPVIPPVLVREEALYGTGFLPDTEQQIYHLPEDDLYLVGTSEVALASLHAGEILDGGDAAAPLRGLLAVLPPRGGRRRARHARHLPRAPVRQGRDVLLRDARRVGGRARAAAGDRGGDPQRARHPLPRGRHRRRRPRRLGGAQVRPRGVAARPGALPRADLVLEHDRLPGAPAGDPAAGPRAAGGRRRCTRSTAPPSPSGARSSRCWRTASARTAASRCPRCSCPTARRRSCRPVALVLSLAGAPHGRDRLLARADDVERRVQAGDLEQPQDGRVRARRAPARPPRRVTRRRPLSRTLSPVESMNSTSARSRTTAGLALPRSRR